MDTYKARDLMRQIAHATWVFARRGIVMESYPRYLAAGVNVCLGTDTAPQSMIEALQKGDEVVTTGGIAGKVNKVSDDFVVIEVSDTVELKIQKVAIAATLPKGTLKAI